MTQKSIAVATALMNLEKELHELHLWECNTPSEEALASTQPFAIDTLTFPQWIQFIFIPRLYTMIENQLPLPAVSGVAPMAEQYFQVLPIKSATLIAQLQKIDALLSSKE